MGNQFAFFVCICSPAICGKHAGPTRTQDPISLEMSCLAKQNLLTDQICLVLQKFPPGYIGAGAAGKNWWKSSFPATNVRFEPLPMTFCYFLPHMASSSGCFENKLRKAEKGNLSELLTQKTEELERKYVISVKLFHGLVSPGCGELNGMVWYETRKNDQVINIQISWSGLPATDDEDGDGCNETGNSFPRLRHGWCETIVEAWMVWNNKEWSSEQHLNHLVGSPSYWWWRWWYRK